MMSGIELLGSDREERESNRLWVSREAVVSNSDHECAARVIYLHTTDRQTVIYYSTIHAIELIYFDSYTQ